MNEMFKNSKNYTFFAMTVACLLLLLGVLTACAEAPNEGNTSDDGPVQTVPPSS